ncbi:polyphenol oxidase family protein [Arthrobacter sp. H41]|uniref:polyphenol oxidase family protein n=1 Tax=Arthrobacter sp. H41 TaxID=1312978 RepID=UPI00047ABB8E|nr:polyphenol oxidase family protein [Arthrobacter sp. H41]
MFFWREQVRPGLHVAFTSAAAGNLAFSVGNDPESTTRNRSALEASLGVLPGRLRFMNQTHSSVVADVGPLDGGGGDEPGARAGVHADPVIHADAMVSADGSVPLAVLVADCVPIVLADRRSRATAVVHAGRQGILDGIVGRTVARLREQGATDLEAWIGPSVCGRCYEVPASMRDEMAALVPAARARTRSGSPSLDLPAAVTGQLEELGVEVLSGAVHPGSILPNVGLNTGLNVRSDSGSDAVRPDPSNSWCTLENPGLFSHRREPGAGRLAGLVWRM